MGRFAGSPTPWAAMLLLAAFLLPAAVSPAAAQNGAPIMDTGAVPYLPAAGREQYSRFLSANLPRALAVAPGGVVAWYGGAGTVEDVRARALKACAEKGGQGCAIYAENLEVVWPGGHRGAPSPPPTAPLITGPGYAFTTDARYIWYGPAKARGLYVWSHGFGGPGQDPRGAQPQPHVRAFNNAGFDVVRFERDPYYDHERDRMAAHLRDGIATLRRQGWRRIVAGGQSRGAWNSLQLLASPGLADAVIAIAPAAHGTDAGNMALRQETDLWTLLHDAASPTTRVAFVQFAQDPYSAQPEHRLALIDSQLRPRVGPVLVIDRPKGLTGHGAAVTPTFSNTYADCLLHFAIDASPPSACPVP